MLALFLSILIGIDSDVRDNNTLLTSITKDDVATRTVISDTLDTDNHPLNLRDENIIVLNNVAATSIDGTTTYMNGISVIDMDTITCPEVRGTHMVRSTGTATTIIGAQRQALVSMMATHAVKKGQRTNSGVAKDGRHIQQLTYEKQMWISHYVMSITVDESTMDYVCTLVAYADR
tara:strand:+ start:1394 stop:1921 length:528 start_codon:yes stop_codon:yes gene_type:complete